MFVGACVATLSASLMRFRVWIEPRLASPAWLIRAIRSALLRIFSRLARVLGVALGFLLAAGLTAGVAAGIGAGGLFLVIRRRTVSI
jgi:hypothetical protein